MKNADLTQNSPSLGIRETRHFEGITRLTAATLERDEPEPDSIALSANNIDIHSGTALHIDLTLVEKPFGIPYGCLMPKDVDGLLLSGRTISVDTTTFASVGVMGPCLAIGEAAGVAAAMSMTQDKALRDLDVQALREKLLELGAAL